MLGLHNIDGNDKITQNVEKLAKMVFNIIIKPSKKLLLKNHRKLLCPATYAKRGLKYNLDFWSCLHLSVSKS